MFKRKIVFLLWVLSLHVINILYSPEGHSLSQCQVDELIIFQDCRKHPSNYRWDEFNPIQSYPITQFQHTQTNRQQIHVLQLMLRESVIYIFISTICIWPTWWSICILLLLFPLFLSLLVLLSFMPFNMT